MPTCVLLPARLLCPDLAAEFLCERAHCHPAVLECAGHHRLLRWISGRPGKKLGEMAGRQFAWFPSQMTIRKLLVEAVEKRLMGNRHFGFMLSGGLDSSLVAGRFFSRQSVCAHFSPLACRSTGNSSPAGERTIRSSRLLGGIRRFTGPRFIQFHQICVH